MDTLTNDIRLKTRNLFWFAPKRILSTIETKLFSVVRDYY
jgi:hypothetical protein